MLLIYLVIFFAIAIALQASARKEHLGTFEKTRINVAVADRDQSELSRGLIRYLSTIHNVSEISSEPSVMQEELFYRNTSYIVQIPENFYQTCIEEEEPLSVTKVPGSYTSFYVDQQISTWIMRSEKNLMQISRNLISVISSDWKVLLSEQELVRSLSTQRK